MNRTAFIPVRGGSKGIPNKNIKPFCGGDSLLERCLDTCIKSKIFDHIIISTESIEIIDIVETFRSNEDIKVSKTISFHIRDLELAKDDSSTEDVMLDYINTYYMPQDSHNMRPKRYFLNEEDLFYLIQVTNPFLTADNLIQATAEFKEYSKNDLFKSLISLSRTKRFYWGNNESFLPINYDYKNRKRRQEIVIGRGQVFIENGSFYINTIGNIKKDKCRLTEPILPYFMPEWTNFEIDTELDWEICELIYKKHFSHKI